LIIGSEIRLDDGPRLVLLATNREGYGNLSELITLGRRKAIKGSYKLIKEDLASDIPDCLALLLPEAEPNKESAQWLANIFPGRAWIAVELLRGSDDRKRLRELRTLAAETGLPLVAAGDVHMHVRARRALQDTMTAIRLKTTVTNCGYALHPNSERYLRPLKTLARIYPRELLDESVAIAERCHFSLDCLRYEYPEELTPSGETPASYLRRLTAEGVKTRFPQGAPRKVLEQIEHELHLIAELQYEPYFLTVYDIVKYAKSHGILCQGRGSAANSAVCYCLGISEVDPARAEMLFERFISKERNEPPDIDVDFEHERREQVMQYVYEKYGRERAALAATVITYRTRSAIRDVGKALGLDLNQVDRLAKTFAFWEDRHRMIERLREAGFDPRNPLIARVIALVSEFIGFPRHLSQHTGGFVISRGLLSRLVPIENAAMEKRTVIQWDKDDLDSLGLLKVDCLALGMLTAIKRALDLVSAYRKKPLTLGDIPAEDPATYEMIGRADTVGVFQIESRAQMSMLPRLRPKMFYDLVIEVAIVRPGPIQGGMVHPYLRRRQGLEAVEYPSPDVQKILERTLGVPIFQEQVMQLAIVAAGFTPGEADQLRRSMAAWRRAGSLAKFEQRLLSGMAERGYRREFARQIFQQIQGFGEYGFPESHSASFAILVYVSAWLKRHEPAAFTCALLNSQPMGFYAPAQLIQDARNHGVEIRVVDVTISDWDCTLEAKDDGEPAIRLGLRMIKGFAEVAAKRFVTARAISAFSDVGDIAQRAQLNRGEMHSLAASGALNSLTSSRRHSHWAIHGIEPDFPVLHEAPIREAEPMLRLPSEGEEIAADYAQFGFTLGRHPLALLRPRFDRLAMQTAKKMREPKIKRARVAGIVTCRQRPDTASGVIFVTLEDETGTINVVVWKKVAERQRRALLQARLLGVEGKVEREGEVIHLIAQRLTDFTPMLGSLDAKSRDFH
ncbi:MAG TPA: error-prone DNA polymerase, partial [Burkholderiales bacterium]|nr:error-prone DNA polymerase [Burkholderiales bacterium]